MKKKQIKLTDCMLLTLLRLYFLIFNLHSLLVRSSPVQIIPGARPFELITRWSQGRKPVFTGNARQGRGDRVSGMGWRQAALVSQTPLRPWTTTQGVAQPGKPALCKDVVVVMVPNPLRVLGFYNRSSGVKWLLWCVMWLSAAAPAVYNLNNPTVYETLLKNIELKRSTISNKYKLLLRNKTQFLVL